MGTLMINGLSFLFNFSPVILVSSAAICMYSTIDVLLPLLFELNPVTSYTYTLVVDLILFPKFT